MRLRVFPRYILIFAVRGKRKMGSGALYTPTRGSYADYYAVQSVTLAEIGAQCSIVKEGAKVGSRGYVIDAFEYDELPAYFWETYKGLLPKHAADAILKEALDFDGYISANLIHEDSIFALEDESERRTDDPSDDRTESRV